MATTQTEARGTKATSSPRNTRRNEIVAIALLAVSVLFILCLLSYNANDASWNTAGQDGAARNLVGAIGANVAAALFQTIGLASWLLPLLLIAAAWRRFRTRHIRAPLSRIVGLVTILFSTSALLSIAPLRPLFDGSFQAGGMIGALVSRIMVSGLNIVGAVVLLTALAATGLLLATNFSFVRAYERFIGMFGDRFMFFRTLPRKFRAWRERKQEEARLRMELRQAARAEREASRAAERELRREKTADERVAEFLREAEADEKKVSAATAIKRSVTATSTNTTSHEVIPTGEMEVAATIAMPVKKQEPVKEKPLTTKRVSASLSVFDDDEDALIEEMVKDASVVRTEAEAAQGKSLSSTASEKSARRAGSAPQFFSSYRIPGVEFLNAAPPHGEQADEELLGLATRLAEKCKEFNVTGQIKHICPGPVVTTYEFKPDPGVKYSRVTGLVDDLCLALKAESIRIDRMPGKPHVGIEVPNPQRETIHLRAVIESRPFRESASKLTIALGKTIDGLNYVADLAKMPHLLIAGATGAGKSVAVNSLIISILYKAKPDEVKFILIDPKRLELGLYEHIPHLKTRIITDPKPAATALKNMVKEMEERYKTLAKLGVRNIDGYNAEVLKRNLVKDYDETTNEPWKLLPYIVIIIDELADLMMVSGHEVEESITRLAQMARAVGIHLVLATQRPSVDVITGLIKANFPSRISFRVSSKVDSRTIIDANGAEQLLGRGDMLFLPPGTSRLVRVHGAYVDEAEIGRIVRHIKEQGEPSYDETITQSEEEALGGDGLGAERDELFDDALRICIEMKRASTSVLQRRLRIGYGRAAAILDMMERKGFIGQADGARPRPMLSRAFEYLDENQESEIL